MTMERDGSAEIAAALDPENEDVTVSSLKHAADDPRSTWRPEKLSALLEQTGSNRVRNAAAIALADLKAAESAAGIAALIVQPEIAAASGTLLYALDRLGATVPLEAFLSVIAHGSYEARGEALELLHADRVDLSEVEDPERLIERLEAIVRDGKVDAAEAAAESLAVLTPRLEERPAPGMRP